VIPGYASAHFYARSVTRIELQELKVKLEHCFYAAGIATGCQVKITYAACG
jgi:metal-dependent amidase/aminoacylase/carboxypeptidase family protein